MRAHQSNLKAVRPERPPDAGWHDTLADGTPVLIRPVRKQDASLERAFLRHLSEQGRHDRFVGVVQALVFMLLTAVFTLLIMPHDSHAEGAHH